MEKLVIEQLLEEIKKLKIENEKLKKSRNKGKRKPIRTTKKQIVDY